jgi:predicted NBD/HSP70 family sugar kinase
VAVAGLGSFAPRTSFTSSAKAVFCRLLSGGPATRPQLCEALDLSRPTMSAAMGELSKLGYVEVIGEVQGFTGRKAAMYRLGQGAGHIIAIDAGSTHIRLRVRTLDGRALYSRTYRLGSNQRHLSAEISRVVDQAVKEARGKTEESWGPLRVLGVAVPTRVSNDGASSPSPTRQSDLFSDFEPPNDIPLVLENNVNCAAIAESKYGSASGQADFAFLQVGVKIGMGVVLGGELVRGRNGAAGEISYLPFPWTPTSEPVPEELENYIGSEAFMQRVTDAWPIDSEAPEDAAALFALAEQGNATAIIHVRRHAEEIGRVIAACISIIDPGFVVLGGGIGSNPVLLPYVQEAVDRLSYPTQIVTSSLGTNATLLGIAKIAAEHAQELLMGDNAA